jgi:uncharacterized membrane protein
VLWHFSVGSFIGALVTDIAYWKTAEMTWANFSAWLLAAGLATAAVATLVFLMDWLLGRLVGLQRPGWISTLGSVVVVVLAVVNSLVHSRDAWTSVVPLGLALSAATVVVIIFTGIIQRGRTYRYMQGVEA